MKHYFILTAVSLAFVLPGYSQPGNAPFANRYLSNLRSPTAVNVNLLPWKNNEINLGSASNNWKNFYLTGSVYKGHNRFLGSDASGGTFVVNRVAANDIVAKDVNNVFGASVYPNPAHGSASLQIKGEGKNTAVTIRDISGKIMWQTTFSNSAKINLPVEKLTAGMYTVTVKSGADVQVIKLVKE